MNDLPRECDDPARSAALHPKRSTATIAVQEQRPPRRRMTKRLARSKSLPASLAGKAGAQTMTIGR
jgi:hypothetical protein